MKKHASRVATVALVVGLTLASGCGSDQLNADLERAPLAVVLMPRQARQQLLVVVDLERFEVVRKIRLRSVALSIDGDERRRLVVTAQSGRPDKHDTAVGIVDVGGGGTIRYVNTKAENPDTVAFLGRDAFVMHGLFDGTGLMTSVVDVERRRLLSHGRVHDRTNRPERFGDAVLVPIAGLATDNGEVTEPGEIGRVDDRGDVRRLARVPYGAMTVVGAGSGDEVLVVGKRLDSDKRSAAGWEIVALDAVSGEVLRKAVLPEITRGVVNACVWGDEVALCDENGMDPQDRGRHVLVLDRETFELKRTLTVPGSPADVDAWGDHLVVTDGWTGELLLFDRTRDTALRRVKVADRGLLAADTVVFPEASDPARD